MNDVFTQVVELGRSLGMGKLGHVAIDSTRIAANAAADSMETSETLRAQRARIRKRIRRWQQQCEHEDPNEGAGTSVTRQALRKLEQQLGEIPVRLERLKKAGVKKLSRSDADSRFLRERRGFTLGYTATLAVSEDHFIVAQQISQEGNDNGLLVPDGGEGGARMRGAAATSERGQRIFLAGQLAGDGNGQDRCVCAGLKFSAEVELRGKIEAACATSSASADEKEIAITGGSGGLPKKKRASRTSDGNHKRATRDAAISNARDREGGHRVYLGGDGVEPDAVVESHSTTTQDCLVQARHTDQPPNLAGSPAAQLVNPIVAWIAYSCHTDSKAPSGKTAHSIGTNPG